MRSFEETAYINSRIKKTENKVLRAKMKVIENPTSSNFFFYYGWLRAWKKALYVLVEDPWGGD
ncbi:hypothetical protein [Sulfurimonas sp.]|uniref:hypothetical protein n=1 Tax=Sulfurimonas sp. TaxID=2022749 RepID=UPI0025F8282B|nr:hypothetical protein [Sulfurimonas sp.]